MNQTERHLKSIGILSDRVLQLQDEVNVLRGKLRVAHKGSGLECFCDDCQAYEATRNKAPIYNADGYPWTYGPVTADN